MAALPAIPTLDDTDGVPTMSSLQMVDYINATREPGKAELRHDSFMAKVPSVIPGCPKFIGDYLHPQNGQLYPLYNFPKREAMLMAMSYSYKLQAIVYDAWQASEAKVAPTPVLGLPATYLDALKQLVANVEVQPSRSTASPRHERSHRATLAPPSPANASEGF